MQKRNPSVLDDVIDRNESSDPIDALVPPPNPWWRRLIIGVLIVGLVGTGAFLWGAGSIRPDPDCCGDSSAASFMSLSTDGRAVTTTASFFNSSGSDLVVSTAVADLPGAEVLDVEMLDPDSTTYPTDDVIPLPIVVAGHEAAQFLITFRPETCDDALGGADRWGTVTLQLDVADSWLPSIGRSYELPVIEDSGDLAVLPPASVEDVPDTPLAAACALLAG